MSIPLFDMAKHLKTHKLIIQSSIARVINSSSLVLGDEVLEFEKEFAAYLGIKHCIGVGNGTDALELALRGLGAGTKTKIAIVGNAGGYSRIAVELIGAKPIYIKTDPLTSAMSIEFLEKTVAEQNIDILIVTHLYGYVHQNINQIVKICHTNNIRLVEDCAQSHGAEVNGKKSGTFGDIGTFSFYPTKNLGSLGDGGAIVCDNEELSIQINSLRQYGWQEKYHVKNRYGRNSRLDEIQAAILRGFLPNLDLWNNSRLKVAKTYLQDIKNSKIILPRFNLDSYVGHLFPLFLTDLDGFKDHLVMNDINFGVHYPIDDQFQPAWNPENEINLDSVQKTAITIPISQYLDSNQVKKIIKVINEF